MHLGLYSVHIPATNYISDFKDMSFLKKKIDILDVLKQFIEIDFQVYDKRKYFKGSSFMFISVFNQIDRGGELNNGQCHP